MLENDVKLRMSNRLLVLVALAVAVLPTFRAYSETSANCVDVTIDAITANQVITGHVSAKQISPTNRVVVYVHTDQWYVHPYVGQGDGLSWASIKANGSWSLETVKRKFNSDAVGAFGILATAPIPEFTPAPLVDLRPAAACVKVLLNPNGANDPDYGKL